LSLLFHVKGSNINARRGLGGILGSPIGADPAVVNSVIPGIGGDDTIDLAGTSTAGRPIAYPGGANIPQTGEISVLMRLYFIVTNVTQGIFKMGIGGRAPIFGWNIYMTSSNQLRFYYYDKSGSADAMFSPAPAVTTGQWVDIIWKYPKTAGLPQEFWSDGVKITNQLAAKTTDPADVAASLSAYFFMLGYISESYDNGRFHIGEIAVWDELIDPTNVALVGGNGSLNGPSRTAYLDSIALDGSNNTWPTYAQVRDTITFYEAGVLRTGSLVIPAVGDVRDGTSYGASSTGTLELPTSAQVQVGIGFGTDGSEFIGAYALVSLPDGILMIDLEEDREDFIVLLDSDADDDELFAVVVEDDAILVIIEEKL